MTSIHDKHSHSAKATTFRGGKPALPDMRMPNPIWALFLDVDGTLLDIAASPVEVTVPDKLMADLVAVRERLDGALALVSGRPLSDLDRLFMPLRFAAAGQHGGEWRSAPDAATEPLAKEPLNDAFRAYCEQLAERFPGVLVEQKSHSVAVHFRQVPTAERELGDLLSERLHGNSDVLLMPGKSVWEIKSGAVSKATAVYKFMARKPFMGRRPIFIGDDHSDEDGFRAALDLGGVALPVGCSAAGKCSFENAADVRTWLSAIAEWKP